MRATLTVLAALGLLAAGPARAQLLGARPGYSNATLKPEQQRQKQQAAQREAARQAAAQAAAAEAARKK